MSAARGSAPLLRSAHDLALLSILFLCSLCVCESMIITAKLDQSNWPAAQLVKQQFTFCSKNIFLGGRQANHNSQEFTFPNTNAAKSAGIAPAIYVIQTYALYGNSIPNKGSTWRYFFQI